MIIFDKEFDYELLKFINSTVSYPIDSVSNVPIKISRCTEVNKIAQHNVALAKTDWYDFETSWDFKKHPLI